MYIVGFDLLVFNICLLEFAGQGKRGKTTLAGLRKRIPKGTVLPIRFEIAPHNTYRPIGDNAAAFSSAVGCIVDDFPKNSPSWMKLPKELKAGVWTDLQVKFLIIEFNVVSLFKHIYTLIYLFHNLQEYFDMTPHESIKTGIEKYIANRYKDHKFRFKEKHFNKKGGDDRVDIQDVVPPNMEESEWKDYVDYYTSPEVKARSKTNKANKGKQTVKGHGGRTSLAQARFRFVSCFNLICL